MLVDIVMADQRRRRAATIWILRINLNSRSLRSNSVSPDTSVLTEDMVIS